MSVCAQTFFRLNLDVLDYIFCVFGQNKSCWSYWSHEKTSMLIILDEARL